MVEDVVAKSADRLKESLGKMEGWQSGNAPDLKSGERESVQGFDPLILLSGRQNGALVDSRPVSPSRPPERWLNG